MRPFYKDNFATIYHGDCREIMAFLPHYDLILTDPPYGNGTEYNSYNDTEENLTQLISQVMSIFLEKADRVVLTPGVANMWKYPKPDWVLCWATPAGAGSGPWGFCCWQPILVYGKDPYLALGMGRRPDYIEHTEISRINGHPCPKPLGLWKKLLKRVQPKKGIILDPLMGSGVTLRAAKDFGYEVVGIDLEEKYCEIASNLLRQDILDFSCATN